MSEACTFGLIGNKKKNLNSTGTDRNYVNTYNHFFKKQIQK